jgi:AraC-like DNA-binding protein
MPILSYPPEESEWIDPDEVRRPVVTFGTAMADARRIEIGPHRHGKGEILFVERGALSCEVEAALWIVPPRSAVWIPAGALHTIKATGVLQGCVAFVDPTVGARLPEVCCAVSVTPLLRELLTRTSHLPAFYEEGGAESRLVSVLLDELASAEVENLHLPMPADCRLRRIVDLIMISPADRGTLDVWARRAGLSERSLARLILRETGMSFGRWRQQLSVMLAVKWLAGGASIQQVAADLGYESVPSFVTMFRKALGTSPGRYMLERHSGRA